MKVLSTYILANKIKLQLNLSLSLSLSLSLCFYNLFLYYYNYLVGLCWLDLYILFTQYAIKNLDLGNKSHGLPLAAHYIFFFLGWKPAHYIVACTVSYFDLRFKIYCHLQFHMGSKRKLKPNPKNGFISVYGAKDKTMRGAPR